MNASNTSAPHVADRVAAELERRILEGSIRPGERLKSERDLALEFGVSRTSLREAVRKLADRGLIATRHGGGNFVTDRFEAYFADPWEQTLSAQPHLHRDLIELRQVLEGQIASLAADRATDADLLRLDRAFEELDAAYAAGDLPRCIETDVRFHQVVAEMAHNVLIGQLTASLMRLIHGHVSTNLEYLHTRPQRWNLLRAQHRAIWQAVRDRDADAAARAAREHMEFVRRSMADSELEVERRMAARRRLGEGPA